jgi:hypothetical protein
MINQVIITEIGFGNFLFPNTCGYNVAEWYCPVLDVIPFSIIIGTLVFLVYTIHRIKKLNKIDKLTGDKYNQARDKK